MNRPLTVLAFVCVGVVLAAVLTNVVTAQSDNLIVPGERVGPIRVEMYREDVIKALGKPDKTVFPNEGSRGFGPCDYYHHGKKYRLLTICYSEPPYRVSFVTVKNLEMYATAKGIRTGNGDSVLGSSVRDVLGAYGTADYQGCTGAHACSESYHSLRITFVYDPEHNDVYSISIP